MIITTARAVRSTIAHLMREHTGIAARLGTIDLREHQREGVFRIIESLNRYGGALLCDEVGLGKTYTAAGVAQHAGPAVVLAPAGLTAMWRESLARTRISSAVISLEKFSRSELKATAASLVIIDEAHHLRNRNTARFRNVAAFIGHARVLLLSATPLHNHRNDLLNLLSLFLGSRAASLGPADESRCVIRRGRDSLASRDLPVRISCDAVTPPVSDQVRRLLLALPPPVPPRDGDDCASLVQFTLLRQWVSSDAALKRGLQARIARSHALTAALDAGTFPTRKELTSWIAAEVNVQLGFAELLASPGGSRELLVAVEEHRRGCEKLLQCVQSAPSSDQWRANYLRSLRKLYSDRKIVAFTQFASTARELYRLLKKDGKVGLVTSSHCEIASGRIQRQELIRRFAPGAARCNAPPEREAVTLLMATDLCSEGLNLQDAGVIMHLDLPWTHARVEQRIGRIARTGSSHREVFIHCFRVPGVAEDLLRLEQRLKNKRRLSDTLVGTSDDGPLEISVADASERIRMLLADWKLGTMEQQSGPVIAFLPSAQPCFVAVIGDAVQREIICDPGNGVSTDPRKILECMYQLGHQDLRPDMRSASRIIARVESWLAQRRLESQLHLTGCSSGVHRFLSRRVHRAVIEAPAHRRAAAAARADNAQRSLRGFHRISVEAQMMELATNAGGAHEWLEELTAVAGGDGCKKAEPDGSGFELLALLVGKAVRRRSGARSS